MDTECKPLALNDDTVAGIALVPAMKIARQLGIGGPMIDFILHQVKWAINEGLRVANDQADDEVTA